MKKKLLQLYILVQKKYAPKLVGGGQLKAQQQFFTLQLQY